jgi:HEAT repeat protein
MATRWSILLVAACFVQASHTVAAFAGSTNIEDRAELRRAQHELRSPNVETRIEAVRRLRDVAGVESAKLLASAGLSDMAPRVRELAYHALLASKDDQQVAPFLLRMLTAQSRAKNKDGSSAAPLAAILLASELPEVQRPLDKLLDVYAASPEGAAILIGVADELGTQDEVSSVTALQHITKLKCFADSFACRRAVVQAMTAIHEPEAVDALIALLPKVNGEVRGDVLRYLATLSGQWFGADPQNWQAWWTKHKDGFRFSSVERKPSLSDERAIPGPSYYGLPLDARRMVFVIDISGSMHGARLAAAQKELTHAIESLPHDTSFSIIAFSDRTVVWRKNLMAASAQAKDAASSFVYMLRAGGRTAAFDALEVAFGFDAEAIYFLSDGEPNAGKIPKPTAIISAVTQTNRLRRISMYTIGIIPGTAGSPLESFMKDLAEKNFGLYRRVSQ